MVSSPTVTLDSNVQKQKRPLSSVCPDDFECSVCCDLLLDPVVAPCGHDMCAHCHQRWTQKSAHVCPLCRSALPRNLGVCLRLQKTIERVCGAAAVARRRDEVQLLGNEDAAVESTEKETSDEALLHSTEEDPLPTYPSGPFSFLEPTSRWNMPTMPTLQQQQQVYFFMGQGNSSSSQLLQPNVTTPQQLAPGMVAASGYMAEGMPVVPASSQLGLFGNCWNSPMAAGADSRSHNAEELVHTAISHSWQSSGDGQDRLAMAQAIVTMLQVRGLDSALGPKLPNAVRLLELILYRTATSKAAYLDCTTLDARVVAAVQQRANAAAARRQRLQEGGSETASLASA